MKNGVFGPLGELQDCTGIEIWIFCHALKLGIGLEGMMVQVGVVNHMYF